MTRLRLRNNDSFRAMKAELKKLPWPSRIGQDVVFHYGDFYQSIVFNALYRRQAKFKGDFVFHYTSFDVFKKLIAPGADLLMTRFDELNDDSELEHGWQRVLRELEWSCGISKLKLRLFNHEMVSRREEGVQIPWLMSFSEAPDSLPQWGRYTNRSTGGCSIAFDFREINYISEGIRKDECGCFEMRFLPCLYNQDEIGRAWRIFCNKWKSELKKIKDLTYQEVKAFKDYFVCPLVPDLFMLAAIIKHPGFESEREWRLIVVPRNVKKGTTIPTPILLKGRHRYGLNMCFAKNRPLYTMNWIRGVGVSPHPKETRSDRFWMVFDEFCNAGRKQWETGVWQSEIPFNGER